MGDIEISNKNPKSSAIHRLQRQIVYVFEDPNPKYFLAVMRLFIMAGDEEEDMSCNHAVIHNRFPAPTSSWMF